jgi:hypothetical protein
MKRFLVILAGVMSLARLDASAVHAAGFVYIDPLYGYSVTTDVLYGVGAIDGGSVPLYADIYQPLDIGLGAVPQNRPALVVQDGGSWVSASKSHGRVVDPAIYQAQRGYTVVVTDYRQGAANIPGNGGRYVPVNGQTVFGTEPYAGLGIPLANQLFPGLKAVRAGIEDFALAMDWTRSHSASLGINPNRIGALGGSAGGIDNLMLQYNDNPVNAAYGAQAVVALVSSTYGNYDRIQPGGPPVFLLNNKLDAVVLWEPQMSQRFLDVGIYREQWFQPSDALYHGVDWNLDLGGLNVMERMRDFLAYQLAGGPYLVPEPTSFALFGLALAGIVGLRRRAA